MRGRSEVYTTARGKSIGMSTCQFKMTSQKNNRRHPLKICSYLGLIDISDKVDLQLKNCRVLNGLPPVLVCAKKYVCIVGLLTTDSTDSSEGD